MSIRYPLGVMDLYPIMANKTPVEDNPLLQAKLKQPIRPARLYDAVRAALKDHPLFGCTMRYEDGYFLEPLTCDFELIHAAECDRPLAFGDNTHGYLWQICYHDNILMFEWCHAVGDGRSACAFFKSILCYYFGVTLPVTVNTELGLESFYDKDEPGIPQREQPRGHRASAVPYIKRGYKTDCHILKVPMKEVLAAAKKNEASPATILPPLFSRVLRRHMKPSVKNKNVRCNVLIDCRTPMKFETMHNCILLKNITYIDRFDHMEFSLVSTIYRAILDLAVQPENIVREATKTVDEIGALAATRPRFVQKLKAKLTYAKQKHTDSNFTFSYLGRLELPDEVMEQVLDVHVRSWTDFGECNIVAIDFGGTLTLNICENYRDKRIIPDFIEASRALGIHFEHVETLMYEQANLRMKWL